MLYKMIKSLTGFFLFLFLMLFTFTTTLAIIIRNEYRDEIIDLGMGDASYDPEIFIRNNLIKTWSEHAEDYALALY